MASDTFLLYGANGYTGALIARHAHLYGLKPILAGRKKEALQVLASSLNLPYLVVDLDDAKSLEDALQQVTVVVHAAGPFQYTARQMAEACLKTKTHYLDINGDIAVFEMLKGYDQLAKKAGIMVLPGVGFDVVPTDCIALALKKQLPDAYKLQLAFATIGGGISHGTAATMASKLGEGGAERKNGKIIRVPLGQKSMRIDFGGKKLFVMSIPWGDISTAYFTTGIGNIETYTGISLKVYRLMKFQLLFNWLLRTSVIRKFIRKKIDARGAGPSDEMRNTALSYVWGRVINTAGKSVEARLTGPEGYTLTTHSTLIIVQKVLNGNFLPGYQTPASVYGENFVLEIPGVFRK